MTTGPHIEIGRVYDADRDPASYNVLVDRLWPRGVAKADAHLDEWAKDVAPSTELRRWYGHVPERFEAFARRYREELAGSPAAEAAARLLEVAATRPLLLLTASRDVEHSGARVLRDHLAERAASARG